MPPRKTLFERMSDIARGGADRKALAKLLKDEAFRAMPDPAESSRFAATIDQLSGEQPRLEPLPMPRRAPDAHE